MCSSYYGVFGEVFGWLLRPRVSCTPALCERDTECRALLQRVVKPYHQPFSNPFRRLRKLPRLQLEPRLHQNQRIAPQLVDFSERGRSNRGNGDITTIQRPFWFPPFVLSMTGGMRYMDSGLRLMHPPGLTPPGPKVDGIGKRSLYRRFGNLRTSGGMTRNTDQIITERRNRRNEGHKVACLIPSVACSMDYLDSKLPSIYPPG